jgi:hypothetical protein
MESTRTTSMTRLAHPFTVTNALAQVDLMRTPSGLRTALSVPGYGAFQGTDVFINGPISGSTLAPTAVKANVLLPISAVVVFGDAAGIRTWSPPV